MASEPLPATAGRSRTHSRFEVDTAWGAIASILAPVASLKLTVVLFIMSIFLVFVGTLAQVDQNMWEIINNYFHSVLVWIPLQVFLPKTWFPNHQSVPGMFPFPGGLTLGTVLFVLVLRFLPTRFVDLAPAVVRPVRLAVSALVAGAVFVYAIVASGARGSVDRPSISAEMIERAKPDGDGKNVVNVILVDFRGLDTMGEITVLVVAAVGAVALARVDRRRRSRPAAGAAGSGETAGAEVEA